MLTLRFEDAIAPVAGNEAIALTGHEIQSDIGTAQTSMIQSLTPLSLDDFLVLVQTTIEASPAWELIAGQAIQKPTPTLFHSRLQRNLVNAINAQTEEFEAIQELRCIVRP